MFGKKTNFFPCFHEGAIFGQIRVYEDFSLYKLPRFSTKILQNLIKIIKKSSLNRLLRNPNFLSHFARELKNNFFKILFFFKYSKDDHRKYIDSNSSTFISITSKKNI